MRSATLLFRFQSVTLQNPNEFDGIFELSNGGDIERCVALRPVFRTGLHIILTKTVVLERTTHSVSLEMPPPSKSEHARMRALSSTPVFSLRKQLASSHAHKRIRAAVTQMGFQGMLVHRGSVFLDVTYAMKSV